MFTPKLKLLPHQEVAIEMIEQALFNKASLTQTIYNNDGTVREVQTETFVNKLLWLRYHTGSGKTFIAAEIIRKHYATLVTTSPGSLYPSYIITLPGLVDQWASELARYMDIPTRVVKTTHHTSFLTDTFEGACYRPTVIIISSNYLCNCAKFNPPVSCSNLIARMRGIVVVDEAMPYAIEDKLNRASNWTAAHCVLFTCATDNWLLRPLNYTYLTEIRRHLQIPELVLERDTRGRTYALDGGQPLVISIQDHYIYYSRRDYLSDEQQLLSPVEQYNIILASYNRAKESIELLSSRPSLQSDYLSGELERARQIVEKLAILDNDKHCPVCLEDDALGRAGHVECNVCHKKICLSCCSLCLQSENDYCPMCRNKAFRRLTIATLKEFTAFTAEELIIPTASSFAGRFAALVRQLQHQKTLIVYRSGNHINEAVRSNIRQWVPNCLILQNITSMAKTVEKLKTDPDAHFFLFNSEHFKSGLNLQFVDNIIITSTFDQTTRIQIEGRLNRIGRTQPINIYHVLPQ